MVELYTCDFWKGLVINMETGTETRMLRRYIDLVQKEPVYQSCCLYMISTWLMDSAEQDKAGGGYSEEQKKKAYKHFCEAMKGSYPAKNSVMRSWFGIGGHSEPSRTKVFQIGLTAGWHVSETERFLTEGLGQTGIQINDYQECIYLYGLEHHLSFDECHQMIRVFERQIRKDVVIEQKTHTEKLKKMYLAHKTLAPENFLLWMCEQGGMFKGYSRTALKYFTSLKHTILEERYRGFRDELEDMLENENIDSWLKQYPKEDESRGEQIRRWLHKNGDRLPTEDRDSLRALFKAAYPAHEKNADLLEILYSSAQFGEEISATVEKHTEYKAREMFSLPENVHFMSGKYLSQILDIAEQKEKALRLEYMASRLEGMESQALCPQDIMYQLADYDKKHRYPETAGEAVKMADKMKREQKQRCQLIQREDLLPLIHMVSQIRYRQEHGEEEYQQEEARDLFVAMADAILHACDMAPIGWEYALDRLLLECFRETYMYSFADLIAIAEN